MSVHDIYEDEEMKCLREARDKFKEGLRILDQGIFAKCVGVINEQREKENVDIMD